MNTRKNDIEYLEQKLSKRKTELGERRVKANLLSTYLQSKDPHLEKMRRYLITCLEYLHDPHVQSNPLIRDMWYENYVKICRLIEDYTAQPHVAGKIAHEVEKAAGYIEAERMFNKLTRKKKGGDGS